MTITYRTVEEVQAENRAQNDFGWNEIFPFLLEASKVNGSSEESGG
jgi:hypothetical protein